MKSFIGVLGIVTLVYVGWVEYSVGNVLIRTNDRGSKSVNPSSLLNLMTNPLRNSHLWKRDTIDLNYPFIVILTAIGYYGLKS